MTAQLSRERLEAIASLPLKTTSWGLEHAPGAYSTVYSHEIVEMARMLLAGMDSNKNARIAESLESLMWPNMAIGNKVIIKAAIDALRAAPPAPVAVHDEAYRNLSNLYHAQEKRLFKLAQRIKGQSFDKYAHSTSQAIDVLEAAIFGEDKDACRAALLKHQSSISASNGAGCSVGIKQPSNNEIATASTVPDGWTANADANAALVMLDRIDTIDCADDERIESIKSIIRRLAAAPEQEV